MKKYLLIVLLFGALLLTACGGGAQSSDQTVALDPVPADYAGKSNPLGSDASTAGAKVFQANCETCHGPQGHGDGPAGQALDPKPKNLPDLAAQVGDDYLFWRISEGKPGTSMVAWKGILTEEQIWQAVAFIRTLK
ncbi:MAG: c-type cytochrome [Chloroflexi bacterium]|nr:c-type cytochrome [Chloroflexota bacterium]